MKYTLAILVAMAVACSAHRALAKPLKVDAKRLVRVLGSIDARIVPQANKVLDLAQKSKKPIYLLVNSPGGSVMAGGVFIAAVELAKARGVKVKCVTSVMAASMAFSILTHCSERYILPSAHLLFHPVWTQAKYINARSAAQMATELDRIDSDLLNWLEQQMGMERDLLESAFYAEKWWTAKELKGATRSGWVTIVTDVTGVKGLFDYKPSSSPFQKGYKIFNEATK